MILPNWNAPKQVKAFSSTRQGGFSQGAYQGLNLGMHVGDDPVLVLRNRQSLVEISAMPSSPIWLNQTHSTVYSMLMLRLNKCWMPMASSLQRRMWCAQR